MSAHRNLGGCPTDANPLKRDPECAGCAELDLRHALEAHLELKAMHRARGKLAARVKLVRMTFAWLEAGLTVDKREELAALCDDFAAELRRPPT